MLTPITLAILGVSVVATSFLSGVFGMAGGLILLGICLALLDVAPAMMLHATAQSASNTWRAAIWYRSIVWPVLVRYTIATLAVFVALRYLAYIPDKATIYILLGLTPFVTDLLPRRWAPDIERPGAPYVCGSLSAVFQILAGVGGPLADIFFQGSRLDRRQIIATKSATQAVGHICRVAYFGSFVSASEVEIPVWILAAAVALAMSGTTLAGGALERMTEESFRRYSRRLIQAIGAVLLTRGVWLLAGG